MEFQFNLGQHSLLRTLNGELVHGANNTFAVFDSAANKIIYRPAEEMALAVTLLSTKTMISKGPLPLASTSSSSHSSSKHHSQDHSSYSYSTSSPSSSSIPMSAVPLPLSSSEIWKKNSGKQTPQDLSARSDLLDLVRIHYENITDKSTCKKSVFKKIALSMQNKGYSFGNREAALVCQDKWKNMESKVTTFLANGGPNNTGKGALRKPDYFDEVFDIIKNSAKAKPKNLQDSMCLQVPESSRGNDTPNEIGVQEEIIADDGCDLNSSRFSSVENSAKPKGHKRANTNDILEFLREDARQRKAELSKIRKEFRAKAKNENKSRKRMLDLLACMVPEAQRKRKREESSSSSEATESDSD